MPNLGWCRSSVSVEVQLSSRLSCCRGSVGVNVQSVAKLCLSSYAPLPLLHMPFRLPPGCCRSSVFFICTSPTPSHAISVAPGYCRSSVFLYLHLFHSFTCHFGCPLVVVEALFSSFAPLPLLHMPFRLPPVHEFCSQPSSGNPFISSNLAQQSDPNTQHHKRTDRPICPPPRNSPQPNHRF